MVANNADEKGLVREDGEEKNNTFFISLTTRPGKKLSLRQKSQTRLCSALLYVQSSKLSL